MRLYYCLRCKGNKNIKDAKRDKMGSNILDSYLEYPPNLVEVLKKKYNLDKGRMEQSLELLEEWIRKQQHFMRKDFDREFLERVLLSRKGSLEKSKIQIEQLCTLKSLQPKFFNCGDVRTTFAEILQTGSFAVLPKLTKDHNRVIITRTYLEYITPEILFNYYRYCFVVAEYFRLKDYSDGFVFIFDIRGVNILESIKVLNPVDIQQLITTIMKGYGARILGIHILSTSKMVDLLINMVKPLLGSKVSKRLHVHQDPEEMYSFVDKDILPEEYGGQEKSMRLLSDMLWDILATEEFQQHLAKTRELRTDESLRLSEQFNEHCIGLPGSFRTLSVD